MVSTNLVTSGILVPWLQFTLRGLMARTTTDEALPYKLLLILALMLALWSLLRMLAVDLIGHYMLLSYTKKLNACSYAINLLY